MKTTEASEALAFVDGCLPPDAAAAFEKRLPGEPALRARVDLWRRQNEALRSVFDARRKTGRSPVVLRLAANANRAASAAPLRRFAPSADPVASRLRAGRAAAAAALAVALLALVAAPSLDPAPALAARAQMAFDSHRQEAPASAAEVQRVVDGQDAVALVQAPDGGAFLLQRTPADAPPSFPPVLVGAGERRAAIWSDGRAYFALAGDAGDAATMREATRLSSRSADAP